MSVRLEKAYTKLRDCALAYPEAWEDFPWGYAVFKVKKKVFVFAGHKDRELWLSVKLPSSGLVALDLPFTSPTTYGLGKSGWITASFAPRDKVPVGMLQEWIDESYRAVAPKTLVRQLDTT